MKRIKKFAFLTISFVMILSLIFGCSSKRTNSISTSPSSRDQATSEEMDMSGGIQNSNDEYSVDDSPTSSPLEPTKVIITFNIDMQTIEFDKSISTLESLISKYEGYVENSNVNLGSYYNQNVERGASYTIRIPKTKVHAFMDETGSIGKINTQNESKEDVTMNYRDTESRLNILNIKEERITTLLKKAEKMEDIITLENTLSDIIYQKESLTGVLKDLDNRVDFSTIIINLQEVQKLKTTEDTNTGFGKRIANAISDSLYYFKVSTENIFISFIYALPGLIILILLAYIVYRMVRVYNKKRRSNDDK